MGAFFATISIPALIALILAYFLFFDLNGWGRNDGNNASLASLFAASPCPTMPSGGASEAH
jgi:hypothetical protein